MPRPTRRAAGFIALAALIAGLVVVGLIGASGRDAAPVAIGKGPRAPSLAGTDPVTGTPVSLADFAGRPVVVNMWASWCEGCVAEAADITRFTEDHPEIGFLGIDVTDSAGGARAFVRHHEWTHPSIFDPGGELGARLNLQGLPTTVFVRADGTIAGEVLGQVTYDQLVQASAGLGS